MINFLVCKSTVRNYSEMKSLSKKIFVFLAFLQTFTSSSNGQNQILVKVYKQKYGDNIIRVDGKRLNCTNIHGAEQSGNACNCSLDNPTFNVFPNNIYGCYNTSMFCQGKGLILFYTFCFLLHKMKLIQLKFSSTTWKWYCLLTKMLKSIFTVDW